MAKIAIIKVGGKQYLVKENDEILVSKMPKSDKKQVDIETVATFDVENNAVQLGSPLLSAFTKAEVLLQDVKGDKIRVAKFRAKVRYRKVTGFRPQLSKIKITQI